MIYLYTFYADLAPYANENVHTPEFAQKRSQVAARDAILLKWMQDNGIGLFPKTEHDAERFEPMFVEYSRRNTMRYFVFQRQDRCSVLNNGVWKDYPDITAAIREIFYISHVDRIEYHRVAAFK